MSIIQFLDLSTYIYRDIIKYLKINDQFEYQRVNKTWRDSTKVVLREYRMLIIGRTTCYGIWTKWFPKGR